MSNLEGFFPIVFTVEEKGDRLYKRAESLHDIPLGKTIVVRYTNAALNLETLLQQAFDDGHKLGSFGGKKIFGLEVESVK
jgi:hypothetical protein